MTEKTSNGSGTLPISSIPGVDLLLRYYGPIAFGLVSLLILWRLIVGPELSQARADRVSTQTIVDSLYEVRATVEKQATMTEIVAKSLEQTARTLSLTGKTLESAVNRLERVAAGQNQTTKEQQ